MTGEKVLALLNAPVATCRFCSCHYQPVRWTNAPGKRHSISDYVLDVEHVKRDLRASR
jgi:hypothetical protein